MRTLLSSLLRQMQPMHRGILAAVWCNAALLAFAAVAMPFDHRSILGLNPWVKPMKFDISVLIYAATVGLLLTHLERSYRSPLNAGRGWPRTASLTGWAIAISMIIENCIISLQSLRGVRSHMNYTSWFNGISFGIMGVFIVVNTVALAVLLLLYLDPKARFAWPPAVVAAARLGLLVLLLGSLEGATIVARNGHTIGAVDGGAGLPFLNWSTAHGDLRVAHFFALHALQIFLLAGWLLSRTRSSRGLQTAGLLGFATAYTAACGWLFHIAMQGRPLLGM